MKAWSGFWEHIATISQVSIDFNTLSPARLEKLKFIHRNFNHTHLSDAFYDRVGYADSPLHFFVSDACWPVDPSGGWRAGAGVLDKNKILHEKWLNDPRPMWEIEKELK